MRHPNDKAQYALSRRRFLKSAAVGSLGAAALSASPGAIAQVLSGGTTAADVQGAGVPAGIVRLNFNENPLGPSPMAVEAIKSHLHTINRYGVNASEIFMKLNRMAGIDYSDLDLEKRDDQDEMWKRNRVYMSDGSGNLLRAAALTYLQKGGELIEAEPGYGDVSEYAEFMDEGMGVNVKIKRIPLDSNMRHDLDAMRDAVTDDTRLVVVTNPNNPTGTIVPRADLERFVNDMPDHVTVLVDEAYMDYVRDPGYRSMADVAIDRPNVLVTRTFSKVYGLPGLRVGYALAMPDTLNNFWVYTSFPSPIAIHAASAALDDAQHVQATKQANWDGREYLYKELDAMGYSYVKTESNFMIIKVADVQDVTRKLARQSVFVRNADRIWKVKQHIRVSIGTRKENEAFINALRQVSA